MTFDISFEATSRQRDGIEAVGSITLGAFCERFTSSLALWEPGDYERQWLKAAKQLLEGKPACFVVSFDGAPRVSGERWVAWPAQEDDRIAFQNELILSASQFDPSDPNVSVPGDFDRTDDEGNEISTWIVTCEDVSAWVASDARIGGLP